MEITLIHMTALVITRVSVDKQRKKTAPKPYDTTITRVNAIGPQT